MPLHWPWSRPSLPPRPLPATPPAPAVELESYRAVADLAQKEYANENDRTKVLDGKAGPLIGATGAAIAFIIGTVVKPPDVLANRTDAFTVAYYAVIAAALLLLAIAQVFFLLSVRVRSEFRRIDVSAWVDYTVMNLPSWEVQARLAATYEEATRANTVFNDRKSALQTRGVISLLAGVIVLLGVPMTIMVAVWAQAHAPCSGCI